MEVNTRGVYGIRKNQTDKCSINAKNNEPDILGYNTLQFCADHSPQEISDFYDQIHLVKMDDYPTKEQIKIMSMMGLVSTKVQTGERDPLNWRSTLRFFRGHLDNAYTMLDDKYGTFMADAHNFICDSEHCAYAYIINLDADVFEFWIGDQHSPDMRNRYGQSKIVSKENKIAVYPCKLVMTIPLDDVYSGKTPVFAGVEMMEAKINKKAVG